MGCGSSMNTSDEIPAVRVQDLASRKELVDQPVRVVGCVAHAGSVVESPFTEKQGVAIRIVAKVPSGGPGGGAEKTLFTATSCVNFCVTDGAQTLLVNVNDQSQWKLSLKKTDDIFNIYRDAVKGCLLSGGERGRISQRQERPHALKFWHDFNQGKDPPSRMTPANGKGMSGFGNRPRMAFEHVLKVGEPVAVTGTLREINGSFTLEADGASSIRNGVSMEKLGFQLVPPTATASKPQVLRMSPSTHRPTLLQGRDLSKSASQQGISNS